MGKIGVYIGDVLHDDQPIEVVDSLDEVKAAFRQRCDDLGLDCDEDGMPIVVTRAAVRIRRALG